jgi:hypothetical protein
VIDHPLLSDPDRKKAFLDLVKHPVGNYRVWAARWTWKVPRVQRFLAALERAGLATIERTRWGTTVKPIQSQYAGSPDPAPAADTEPILTQYGADTEPIHLGSTRLKQSLGLGAGLDESNVDNYTAACIETMNEQLSRIFGVKYRPVLYDNRRSGLACDHWKAAGVDLDFAIQEIRKACLKFHPEKHGRGKLPGTLGYFERGVLEAHATRAQMSIPLPPVVQRGGDRTRGGKPAPLGDFMSAYMAAGGKERGS